MGNIITRKRKIIAIDSEWLCRCIYGDSMTSYPIVESEEECMTNCCNDVFAYLYNWYPNKVPRAPEIEILSDANRCPTI